MATASTPDTNTPFTTPSASNIARATVFERLQIGLEDPTTRGTAVACANRVLAIELDLEAVTPTMDVEAAGYKAPIDLVNHKDSSKGTFKGSLCFNTVNYFLASGLCLPTITTVETGVRQFDFIPSVTSPDVFQSYTVQKGSDAAAEGATYVLVSGMDLDFADKNADMKGDLIGGRLVDNVAFTATPVDIAVSPVSPNSLNVYVATSLGGLAAGKLLTCFAAKFAWKDRHKPRFTLNSAQVSYKDTVESKFNATAQVVIEEDDTIAKAQMLALRTHARRYCRISMTGAAVGLASTETIEITFAFKFKANKMGDKDGTYSGTFDLLPIYDSNIGGFVEIRVVTVLSAL